MFFWSRAAGARHRSSAAADFGILRERFTLAIAVKLAGFVAVLTVALGTHSPAGAAGVGTADLQQLVAREARLGPNDPARLPLLDRIAAAEFRNGKWDQALQARQRAMHIALVAAPRQAMTAVTALATLYVEQQRYLDAEPLLLAAAGAAGKSPRAFVFAGLARIAGARGDADAAVTWAQKGAALAPEEPDILRALGAAMGAAHRTGEAERALNRALSLDRERHGSDSPEAARSLSLLANLYFRDDRPQQALPLIEEATAIDQAHLPPGHPFIGDDLHDLGLVYEGLKRRDEALRVTQAALRSLQQGTARDTPREAYVESDLSRLYREAGDEDAAETALRNARRILNKAEAEEHRRERKV